MFANVCSQCIGNCSAQVELHQTKLAVEAAEVRLRQVEVESKQKLDQLQELRSKVREKGELYEMQNA